jgi:hypothetical protein
MSPKHMGYRHDSLDLQPLIQRELKISCNHDECNHFFIHLMIEMPN